MQERLARDSSSILNEDIGGVDANVQCSPARTTADLHALRTAYESGRVLNGGGGLSAIAIIDYRDYRDSTNGDQHMRYPSFSTRERLIKANGHADNQIMSVDRDPRTRGHSLFSAHVPGLTPPAFSR